MNKEVLSITQTPAVSGIAQSKAWMRCGLRHVLERKSLWFGMTAVYLGLGFFLKQIPFMGDLLLVLITPMLLASVVWGLAHGSLTEAPPLDKLSPIQAWFQTWLAHPAQELLRIFSQEDKMFAAILLGIITLGLVTGVKILGYLLVGGSMVTGLAADQSGIGQITMLLGMAVVAFLFMLLSMGLLFSVPLTILGNRQPLEAIAQSFSTCRENAVPLLALAAPFFLVYLVIVVAYARFHWLGYLLLFSLGFLALPVFVTSVYCSYLTLYPAKPSDLPRPIP